jgi:hypothetical protein
MGTGRIAAAFIFVGLALFCVASSLQSEPGNNPSVKLNPLALAYAKELIENGRVVLDRKGACAKNRLSTEPESEFIRQHGFVDYAKWYLAIDERYSKNTKRRYKFSYGDFKNVHRCALLAIASRARQYGYSEIETAAAEPTRVIENKHGKSGRALPHSPAVAGAPD